MDGFFFYTYGYAWLDEFSAFLMLSMIPLRLYC